MAVIDHERSGDTSQDESRLREIMPSMFQSVAFTQMSLPFRPMFGGTQPTPEETEQEGRILLAEFVTEEIRRNHVVLDHPEDVQEVLERQQQQQQQEQPQQQPQPPQQQQHYHHHHHHHHHCNDGVSQPGSFATATSISAAAAVAAADIDADLTQRTHDTYPRHRYCTPAHGVNSSPDHPASFPESASCRLKEACCTINPAELVYSHLAASPSEAVPDREEILQSHPMFRRTGRELCALADEFARSRERQRVKERAEALSVASITRDNLMALMTELFRDGFSRERLITLFFFCSDLIIKALREVQEGTRIRWEILVWVWEFFCERVCSWVQDHGGWENVICNYLPKAVMVTTGVAITAGIAFYIWKNW